MSDVKELCERVLAVPAPPLPDGRTVLEVARRASRRRTRAFAGSGLCVAVIAVTSAVAMAVPVTDGQRTGAATANPDARTTASLVASPTGAAPLPATPPRLPSDHRVADRHGDKVAEILVAAVPAGYTPDTPHTGTATYEMGGNVPDGMAARGYVSQTTVTVVDGDRRGMLGSFLHWDGGHTPKGGLCARKVTRYLSLVSWHGVGWGALSDKEAECERITVDGVAVRVATVRHPRFGEVKVATRLVDGGSLTVASAQGTWTEPRDAAAPQLTTPVFTSREIAEIAANPSMLPT